jgi:hypothetical protein
VHTQRIAVDIPPIEISPIQIPQIHIPPIDLEVSFDVRAASTATTPSGMSRVLRWFLVLLLVYLVMLILLVLTWLVLAQKPVISKTSILSAPSSVTVPTKSSTAPVAAAPVPNSSVVQVETPELIGSIKELAKKFGVLADNIDSFSFNAVGEMQRIGAKLDQIAARPIQVKVPEPVPASPSPQGELSEPVPVNPPSPQKSSTCDDYEDAIERRRCEVWAPINR